MKSKTKIKICDYGLAFCIAGLILLILSLFFIVIIEPAYLNYKNIEKTPENFVVTGRYNPATDKIYVYLNKTDENYERVLKHELCHQSQYKEERLYPNEWRLFLNEIEAKISEYLTFYKC